jgi:hypothetical protein
LSLPAGPVFPPFDATYCGRAKISLNNTLKSRFIRRADGTNARQIAANLLTIRSPHQRRFRKRIYASIRGGDASTPNSTATRATGAAALS